MKLEVSVRILVLKLAIGGVAFIRGCVQNISVVVNVDVVGRVYCSGITINTRLAYKQVTTLGHSRCSRILARKRFCRAPSHDVRAKEHPRQVRLEVTSGSVDGAAHQGAAGAEARETGWDRSYVVPSDVVPGLLQVVEQQGLLAFADLAYMTLVCRGVRFDCLLEILSSAPTLLRLGRGEGSMAIRVRGGFRSLRRLLQKHRRRRECMEV